MSNFLQEELKKLFGEGSVIRQPKFVGRSCLGCIDANLRVRVEFVCLKYEHNYDGLSIKIIRLTGGLVDELSLRLADVLEIPERVSNFNFPGGEAPLLWVDNLRAEWYAVQPTEADYESIRRAAAEYIQTFRLEVAV